MNQKIYAGRRPEDAMTEISKEHGISRLMVVSGKSCSKLEVADRIRALPLAQTWFSEFRPNPDIESVRSGIRLYRDAGCDAIMAIGGGSAMDVAKGIKLYADTSSDKEIPTADPVPNRIPLIAIPTTAGTGSEATRYAVVYKDGVKQSLTSDSIIPSDVIMLPELLVSLPLYQKKCTVMDAMCHAIESYWSVNSTDESKQYAERAIQMILNHLPAYLEGKDNAGMQTDSGAELFDGVHLLNRENKLQAAEMMLQASNLAGRAINITQTTAGHAMCYKITTLYGLPHGHAAALCVNRLWPYMEAHINDCIDQRGEQYLRGVLASLSEIFARTERAIQSYSDLMTYLDLESPGAPSAEELRYLTTSVNPERLKNNPVRLSQETILALYQEILG